MSGPLIALSLLGAGMQAYNQYQSSKAEAQSLLQRIELNNIRADEMESRLVQNIRATERASQSFQETQKASMAGSGFEVGGVATLQQLEDTASKTVDQIEIMRQEVDFELRAIEMENESLRSGASRIKKAGKLSAFASLLGGGVNAYKASPKGMTSTSKNFRSPAIED